MGGPAKGTDCTKQEAKGSDWKGAGASGDALHLDLSAHTDGLRQ